MMNGLPYTFADALPEGTGVTPRRLVAPDGFESSAWLYEPAARARIVFVFAHPRVEFGRHYAIPPLLRAGYAVIGHNPRSLNNDAELIYEKQFADLAMLVRLARERFEVVVLAGNSGGGTLLSCYQAQAAPDARGDAFAVIAAHAGEGRFLVKSIDPSVTDEDDPLSCDPALDMFNPANGYDLPSRTARYDAAWLTRYRAAQRERVARLDTTARARVDAERAERARLGEPKEPYELLRASRRAIPHRLMLVHRTVANPAYLDLSIDPNDREVGSIFGLFAGRPEFGNYFEYNVARVLSARAWLSTWSALSSKASFVDAAPKLTVPTLFVPARGDSDILPAEADEMWASIGAPDRARHDLERADHYLRPTKGRATDPRAELVEVLDGWVRAKF
jgi:hypothetical protein